MFKFKLHQVVRHQELMTSQETSQQKHCEKILLNLDRKVLKLGGMRRFVCHKLACNTSGQERHAHWERDIGAFPFVQDQASWE